MSKIKQEEIKLICNITDATVSEENRKLVKEILKQTNRVTGSKYFRANPEYTISQK